MHVRRRTLVVFTRSPAREARAKGFEGRAATRLFEAFLRSWTDLARQSRVSLVVSTPDACGDGIACLPIGRAADAVLIQEEGSFGERLERAALAAFAGGARSVVVVGGDGPAVRRSELEAAFGAVETGELVLGPAVDGGVYLIGVDASAAILLRTIAPGERALAARLAGFARALGRSCRRLSARDEIDAFSDVRRIAAGADVLWVFFRGLLFECLRGAGASGSLRRDPAPGAARFSPPRAPPRAA